MLKYTYGEIEKAVRGKVLAPTRRKIFSGNVSLDTRTLQAGDMFVPLKGPHFNGHDHIGEAFEKGARIILAESGSGYKVGRKSGDVIYVESTLTALGRLAAFHRRKFSIPVIAVTGSCGKTTTKDLIAHLLTPKYRVLKSMGTENNYVGVPKTLLQMEKQQAAVVEIGSNHSGEVYHLSRLVQPTVAVLTMIGNAHLSGFRNVQGVKKEKLSMIDSLDNDATVVINGDDKNVSHPRFKKLKTLKAGFSRGCQFRADSIELLDDGVRFRMITKKTKRVITTRLLGHHNVMNLLIAVAACSAIGAKENLICDRITDFTPTAGRVRYQEFGGVHWIDDSYNSNPSSLQAAIELFKVYPPRGRKILVIGDMLELGRRASLFHREAGRTIAKYSFDFVLTVGSLSKELLEGAVRMGFSPAKVKSFETSVLAAPYIHKILQRGDTVLLKGSRGMRMEVILSYFKERQQK